MTTYDATTRKQLQGSTTYTIVKDAVKQTIQAKSSYKKKVGDKAFSLNAKAKTPLTYTSSNKKIAVVDKNGNVIVKKAGNVTITVKAQATSQYQEASKTITITVAKKATK